MTDLQEWISTYAKSVEDSDMLWKGAWGSQVLFVRDELRPLIGAGLYYQETLEICKVIGTHRSKSLVLPVYELARPDLGLRIILRDNFYNWKMSVITEKPLAVDLVGLCFTSPPREPDYTGDCLAPCYFEGFPADLIFGYYDTSDGKRWSGQFGQQTLYIAIFNIMKALGEIRPLRQHTAAEHRAELDAQSAFNKKWDAEHPNG